MGRKYWTEEEKIEFIKLYPNYNGIELVEKFYPELTIKQLNGFADRIRRNDKIELYKTKSVIERTQKETNKKIGLQLKGRKKTAEQMEKVWAGNREYMKRTNGGSLRGRIISQSERDAMSKRKKGIWAGENNPRHKNPLFGKDNGRWEGGIKPLIEFLRMNIGEWKQESMKSCNHVCVLTKMEFDNVHHLYPFRKIVDEVFSELELKKLDSIGLYSEEQKINIINLLHEKHKKYGLGVCLTKQAHKQFHDRYGYTNNTPEQFYEFSLNEYGVDIKQKYENKDVK